MIGGTTNFIDRRMVNAGPFYKVVFFVRRKRDLVGGVVFGEKREFAGVEVDEGVVEIVGILTRVITGQLDEGSAGVLVDSFNFTDNPVT